MAVPGRLHELEYRWGDTHGSLGSGVWKTDEQARACVDQPLTLAALRSLDECLDVAPSPDFILFIATVNGALAITPMDHCAKVEEYLCDANSAYFACARNVAAVLPRSASECWRRLSFATLLPDPPDSADSRDIHEFDK